MTGSDLQVEQIEPVHRKAQEMTRYLHHLYQRLQANHFPVDDQMLRASKDAFNAVQHLMMTLHYLECDAGRKR